MKIREVVHIFVERRGVGLFLQHRDDKPGIFDPGTLCAFGGLVEPFDKNVEAAARRELAEETGLTNTIAFLGTFQAEGTDLEGNAVMRHFHAFSVTVDPDLEIPVYEGQGGVTIRFGEKIPDDAPMAPSTKQEIKKYYVGRFS